MKVTVVGTGYVGLVQGVCLAERGHDVTCVDIDAAKIEGLEAGRCPIFEPGLERILSRAIAHGRLRFATPRESWAPLLGDVVFVTVGTPTARTGSADLSAVHAAVRSIAGSAEAPVTIAMKSTVPMGTGRMLQERYLTDTPVRIGYVSNPEFLREGHAVHDWYHADRIVLGGEDRDVELVGSLYDGLDAPTVVTDVASAETIKYASNAFLSTKISFVNEIANVCDFVGADIDAVSHGIGMDPRIGSDFLRAGIGYGGSCFPKDTRALDFISTLNGYRFELLRAVIDVNNRQRLLPVIHLARALHDLAGSKIAVLGLAFKPHTDDVRESPALDIVPLLAEEGARIDVYDPLAAAVDMPGARRVDTLWEALEDAAAAIVVTEWPEFIELDWREAGRRMATGAIVFDGRNALDPESVRSAGLRYMAVGRPGEHRAEPLQ